jgi:hypothetical protein
MKSSSAAPTESADSNDFSKFEKTLKTRMELLSKNLQFYEFSLHREQ